MPSPKTIIFIRHAQAVAKASTDFERSLDVTGLSQAQASATAVAAQGLKPDVLYISPALRTRQTATPLIAQLAITPEHIVFQESLYNAEAHIYVDLLTSLENDLASVAFVGHNPGVSLAAHQLCNEVGAFECGEVFAIVSSALKWSEVGPHNTRVAFHFRP